jgi:hypothetical protein
MTTISCDLARCSPAKRTQFLGLAVAGMKIFERHGAAPTRMLQPVYAGPQSDLYVLANELAGVEQHGEFVDGLYRDGEFEAFMDRAAAPDSPVTFVSRMLCSEVPLGREGPTDPGVIITAYTRRALPGRFEECCDIFRALYSFLEEEGGSNCRLFEMDLSGPMTGQLLGLWECDSMRTRGKVLKAFASSPAGRAVGARFRSGGSPMSITWSGLYRDLRI